MELEINNLEDNAWVVIIEKLKTKLSFGEAQSKQIKF